MKILPYACLFALLAGCIPYQEGRVGPLGSTVNATLYQQIADKNTAADPGTALSPVGADGPLTEQVLDGYRGITGDAQQVAQPIQINVGN
ncbi:hypothetical protein BAY1663_02258 [Pseudomonas sp. BAY1663]|uniref:Lipoprotein n=1 Tax=Stutzerimonas stutzeri TaxID=316 RepID=A0A2N8SXH0_STUST|nr:MULTISPECIES: hypothetical protein [Pseudomonadaceae]EXF45301.1 hypothetical protein BAY1663_02258 [Pseudomonas sp. BAY1663]MCQ4326048.1 hypothetical protein [Stutzerimonas stutzeri]PNG07175.1 hypothetical protein CXK94_17225 [Stutzerimonas stutzeri]